MGYIPHDVGAARRGNLPVMKTNSTKRYPTFGEFITRVYDTCGDRKAEGVVRLAVAAHLIEFRGRQRFAIS